MIDETGHTRLADFGLLTIISDPANLLSSGSYTPGGTARWTSPELIAPQRFGFKNSRPTKASDCYALGMVIYETISGNLPFHKHTDLTVIMKVLEGEHPSRGVRFTESLWKMLELCWEPQPNDRPSIEDVLRGLEIVSNSSELPPPVVEEEEDSDGSDSISDSHTVQNGTSDTMMTERSTPMSYGPGYLTGRPPSSVSSIGAIVEDSPILASDYLTLSEYFTMVRMVGSQHISPIGHMLSPQNEPSNMNHISGNRQQGHSPGYPHYPVGTPPSINEINSELMHIPDTLLPKIEQELMIPQDRDFATMTVDEKVRSWTLRTVRSFTIPFSDVLLFSTTGSTVVGSIPDQVILNDHLALLAHPWRLRWHLRTLTATPQSCDGKNGSPHLL